jgi:hypothetical protein
LLLNRLFAIHRDPLRGRLAEYPKTKSWRNKAAIAAKPGFYWGLLQKKYPSQKTLGNKQEPPDLRVKWRTIWYVDVKRVVQ